MNIELQLNRQINIFVEHLKNIQSKLNDTNDVDRVVKTIDWLNEKKPNWINRIRQERIKK